MSVTRQDHPLPARIMHHVLWISIFLLAFSGLYIHRPFFDGDMAFWRRIHHIMMFVVVLNAVARLYWAIFSRRGDLRVFLPEKANRGKLLPMIAYYLFLRKTHPSTGKYNPLQKLIFVGWFFLLIVQAITGFAMYWHAVPFFTSLNNAVGGLAVMHAIHYLLTYVFIASVIVHVYLALFEGFRSFLVIFFGIESKKPN